LVLALYLVSTSIQNDIARSGATLGAIQETLVRLSTPVPEIQALTATLTATLNLANTLEAARPPSGVNWPAVMAFIGNYNPTEITLTSLAQSGSRITLTGQATSESAVVEYTNALKASTLFSDVVTQSLKRIIPDAGSEEISEETIEFVIVIILGVQSS
jgi:Tfp pilus assembly protein PilN